MHDSSTIWSPQPDWREATLEKPGLRVQALRGLVQHLVSGDFAAWAQEADFPPLDVGGFGLAHGDRYRIRLARDRILAVGFPQSAAAPGWRAERFAVTPVSAGLLVFEITGLLLPEIIARATTLDPSKPSPSAAMSFAGAQAIAYRYCDPGTLRIHIERPLGSQIWTWLATVAEMLSPAEAGLGDR